MLISGLKQSPCIYDTFRYDPFRVWHSKIADYARMRPDDRRGGPETDDTMAKEKAMMKARAPKDNVTTTKC
jgi:hypothetical protein